MPHRTTTSPSLWIPRRALSRQSRRSVRQLYSRVRRVPFSIAGLAPLSLGIVDNSHSCAEQCVGATGITSCCTSPPLPRAGPIVVPGPPYRAPPTPSNRGRRPASSSTPPMHTSRKRCAVCGRNPLVSEKLNVHFCDPLPNPVDFPEGLPRRLIVCYGCVRAHRGDDGLFRWVASGHPIVLCGHHFWPKVSLRNHKLELRDASGC
jgi:hypothetical protein